MGSDLRMADRVVTRYLEAKGRQDAVPMVNKETGRTVYVTPETLKKDPSRFKPHRPDEEDVSKGRIPERPAKPQKPRRPRRHRAPLPHREPYDKPPQIPKPVPRVKRAPRVKPVPVPEPPKPHPKPLVPGLKQYRPKS